MSSGSYGDPGRHRPPGQGEIMSRARNRRYYSGRKKRIWWIEKRHRLYCERGGVCEKCNRKYPLNQLQLHHIAPRCEGGRDIDLNVKLLCRSCHDNCHGRDRPLRDPPTLGPMWSGSGGLLVGILLKLIDVTAHVIPGLDFILEMNFIPSTEYH